MQKECNVVMSATDNSELYLKPGEKLELTSNRPQYGIKNLNFTPQHLYITSDDEIKEGDCCYKHDLKGNVFKWINTTNPWYKDAKKIIATTDESLHEIPNSIPGFNFPDKLGLPKLSQEFIELFIKHYNTGNPITKVMVEYEFDNESHINNPGYHNQKLLINPDNTINIKTIKDSWSRDEVAALMNRAIDMGYNHCKLKGQVTSRDSFNKWIEQNL